MHSKKLCDSIINVALDIPETGKLNQIINYLKGSIKLKKLLVTLSSVVVVVALFTVVAYGSSWMNFTGEGQIDQSDKDVAEILEILKQVHDEKELTQEQLEDLEALNIKEIARLKEDIKSLENNVTVLSNDNEKLIQDKAKLTTDLAAKQKEVNDKQKEVDDKQKEVNNKQKEIQDKIAEINEKNGVIDEKNSDIAIKNNEIATLESEKNTLTAEKEDLKTQLAEAKSNNEGNSNYIAHLEGELEKANNTVAAHGGTTESALEKAKTYVND